LQFFGVFEQKVGSSQCVGSFLPKECGRAAEYRRVVLRYVDILTTFNTNHGIGFADTQYRLILPNSAASTDQWKFVYSARIDHVQILIEAYFAR
jgi:hypothetical protein